MKTRGFRFRFPIRVSGSCFPVSLDFFASLRFRLSGFGTTVWGSGIGVAEHLEVRLARRQLLYPLHLFRDAGFRVSGFGFRFPFSGFEVRVDVSGAGFGFRVQDFRVQIRISGTWYG